MKGITNLHLWTYRQLKPNLKKSVLERDNHKCRNCEKTTGLEIHHLVS
jgi:5-methylcytosine-specific restriction endonuclease McrA